MAANVATTVFGWAYEARDKESPGGEEITASEVAQLLNAIGGYLLNESPYVVTVDVKPGKELEKAIKDASGIDD